MWHGNIAGETRLASIQSVQRETSMSRDKQEQTNKNSSGLIKHSLTAKNTGTGEKRKRNVGTSGIVSIKREAEFELNADVSHFLFEKEMNSTIFVF